MPSQPKFHPSNVSLAQGQDGEIVTLRLPEWLTVEQRDELRRALQLIFSAMLASLKVGVER